MNSIFTGQTKVWTRPAENSSFRMIRLQTIFNDINADTLYDVLHDPVYRKVNQKTLKSYKIRIIVDMGQTHAVFKRAWYPQPQ